MFNKKEKLQQRQEHVKLLLADLYNGLSLPEYGNSYDDFKQLILETYQKVDQGKWAGERISEIIATIQHIAIVNTKYGIASPSVFGEVRPQLEKHIRKPLLGLWIYH